MIASCSNHLLKILVKDIRKVFMMKSFDDNKIFSNFKSVRYATDVGLQQSVRAYGTGRKVT